MNVSHYAEIKLLKSNRPKSVFLTGSAVAACLYLLLVWKADFFLGSNAEGLFPNFSTAEISLFDYGTRLRDFAVEVVPYPVREGQQLVSVIDWAWSLFVEHAFEAACFTVCIALLSVILAASLGYLSVLLEAAAKLRLEQIETGTRLAAKAYLSALIHLASNSLTGLLVLMRAVPDLIWAYVLLSVLGPTCWTAIAALAIHNCGILGRIGRDVIYNASYSSLQALRYSGADNCSLVVFSMLPEIFSKLLIHVFYRWETCLRDAVIVGMIGLPTLGFWIFQDAWPKFRYDEMMFYIVLSFMLISAIEGVSHFSRRFLRIKISEGMRQ